MAGCDSCDGSARLIVLKIEYEKVISMLLIHDLGEIYAGDTWYLMMKKKLHAHDRELDL